MRPSGRQSSSIPIATCDATSSAAAAGAPRDHATSPKPTSTPTSSLAAVSSPSGRAPSCCCRTKAMRTGSTPSPRKATLIRGGDRMTIGNVLDRRRAHAGSHARAPDVPGHRRRGRGRADCGASPAISSSSATSAAPICSNAPRTIKGTMEVGARTLYQSLQAFKRSRRLAADLARARRRIVVRQGHQRGAAQHARLRAPVQLGIQGRQARRSSSHKVLSGQPDPPKYFATMKRLNKEGPAYSRRARNCRHASPTIALSAMLSQGGARHRHAPGSRLRGRTSLPGRSTCRSTTTS